MKEIYRHLVDAQKDCTQTGVLLHIENARTLLNIVADDEGVLFSQGEID
jgi:hypothetical protein